MQPYQYGYCLIYMSSVHYIRMTRDKHYKLEIMVILNYIRIFKYNSKFVRVILPYLSVVYKFLTSIKSLSVNDIICQVMSK